MKIEKIKDRNKRAMISDRLARLREYRDEIATEVARHKTRIETFDQRQTEILTDLAWDIGEPNVPPSELEARINLDTEEIAGIEETLHEELL